MKTIKGKAVFENYHEMLDPKHTAVLVIDTQVDGYDPNGYFGRIGAKVDLVAEIVLGLKRFLDEARKAGARVVYVNQTAMKIIRARHDCLSAEAILQYMRGTQR